LLAAEVELAAQRGFPESGRFERAWRPSPQSGRRTSFAHWPLLPTGWPASVGQSQANIPRRL